MAFRKENDWVQTGWKVWAVPEGTSNIEVYNSVDHNWDTDVPNVGVQAMYRYYKDSTRKWREAISGDDIYIDDDDIRDLVKVDTTLVKTGVPHAMLWIEAIVHAATQGTIDNSIASYIDPKKVQQGFIVYRNENEKLAIYDSDQYTWTQIPNDNIVHMFRKHKLNGGSYLEAVNRQTFYIESTDQESIVIAARGAVKGGSVIDDVLFEQVNNMYQSDTDYING